MKRINILIIIVLVLITCTNCTKRTHYDLDAEYPTLQEGIDIFNEKYKYVYEDDILSNREELKRMDYIFKKHAAKGNYEAMGYLGVMYDRRMTGGKLGGGGKGVKFHKKAAKHNFPMSMRSLALRYLSGAGVRRNHQTGLELLQRLDEMGETIGLAELGHIYKDGTGLEVDYAKAFEYFKRGADANEPNAMFGLGLMYFHGYHVSVDYKKAIKLFNRVKDLHIPIANYYLGYMYAYGKGVEVDFRQSYEINHIRRYRMSNMKYTGDYHFEYGKRISTVFLDGYLFEHGFLGYKKFTDSRNTALKAYKFSMRAYKSAFKNDIYCGENRLANLYMNDRTYSDVIKDKATGMKYLEESATKGCLDANIRLYYHHLESDSAKADLYEAQANKLLITKDFNKFTDNVYLTVEEYYGRPYIHKWLNKEADKENMKAKEVLRLLQESEKYNLIHMGTNGS